jgi:tRNA pseudouridine55 synthase
MGVTTTATCHAALIDGVLVARKEAGWTSHDVVAKVRRILNGAKVGHAGTLDPAATGVLPLLIGRATRLAEYLVRWDKEYRAVLRLGITTDTQDASGQVLSRADSVHVSEAALRDAVARFLGHQQQLPPMYSAVKVAGRPLYQSARAGRTIERKGRAILVHELEILAVDGRDVTLNIVCSKGTYIRTLCADIGQFLGVGGHLYALERRRVGPWLIEQAQTVDEIAMRAALGTLRQQLISMDRALEELPALVVSWDQAQRVLHGGAVAPEGMDRLSSASMPVSVRLKDQTGRLLAIGTYDPATGGPVKIDKVLAKDELCG